MYSENRDNTRCHYPVRLRRATAQNEPVNSLPLSRLWFWSEGRNKVLPNSDTLLVHRTETKHARQKKIVHSVKRVYYGLLSRNGVKFPFKSIREKKCQISSEIGACLGVVVCCNMALTLMPSVLWSGCSSGVLCS